MKQSKAPSILICRSVTTRIELTGKSEKRFIDWAASLRRWRSQYKGHVIRVTAEKNGIEFPWKPICRILDGASREFIKQLDWQIGYDTPDQAEKVGLLISLALVSKMWQLCRGRCR